MSTDPITTDLEKATSLPNAGANGPLENTENKAVASSLVDWDGPNDKENPQNWSIWKKSFHVYVLSWLSLATTVGVSSFSVAIGDVGTHFHVSRVAATIPLTIYVIGQALGPCIAAPVSETYGRKGVFLITTPLGLLFTLGSGFSQKYSTLCVLRFLAGVFSSPSLSVGGGILADILTPENRAAGIGVWTGTALLGTSLGPILAGYAVQYKDWRWTQWIFVFVTLVGWIPSLFTSESYKKIILARREKQRGQAPHPDVHSRLWDKAKFFLSITLLRPVVMLSVEPIVAFFAAYLSVVFSVLFSFFDAFPIVFSGVYKFDLGETGLSFIGLFIGVAVGIALHILIDRVTYKKSLLTRNLRGDSSPVPPEERLYFAMLGALFISVALFWFAWSSKVNTHWMSSELATVLFGMGTVGVSAPCLQYLLDVYGPLYGASAVGANNLSRYVFGGVSPLYTRQMFAALGIHWAISLLAFVTVALLPVPFICFKYGITLRARSSYKPVAPPPR